MNDPRRLLDPKGGDPTARSLLEAGLDMDPPPGAREQVWSQLSGALGATAAVGAAKVAASSAKVAGAGATSIGPAAGASGVSAGGSALATSSEGAGAAKVAAGKLGFVKLVAGKWILLSVLAVGGVVAAVAVPRVGGAPSNVASVKDAPSSTDPTAKAEGASKAEGVSKGDAASTSEPAVAPNPAEAALSARAPSVSDRSAAGVADAESSHSREPRVARVAASARPAASAAAFAASSTSESTPSLDVASSPGKSRLAEESAALADARARLVAGDATGALRALSDMDRDFGQGGLSQERAVLTIRALAESGQRALAAQKADAFLAAYPQSPLAARVQPFASQP
jgi:hypothetical protein